MADALQLSVDTRWPGFPGISAAVGNTVINASNGGVAAVFQAQSADPITHLGWRYGARTGTPPTYIASLQSVVGTLNTGYPSGTILGGGSPASVTFTPPADTTIDGLWQWYALANAYAPARGDVLATCIEYSSGTIDGSNNSSFTRDETAVFDNIRFPYVCSKSGGWSQFAPNRFPIFGWRTANGRYGYPYQSQYTTTTSTTGNRQAMRFTLNSGYGSTFKVVGVKFVGQLAAVNCTLNLWDGTNTVLQTVTVNGNQVAGGGNSGLHEIYFATSSLIALSFGTQYRIGLECVGSSAINLRGIQLGAAADASAYPLGTARGFSSWNGSAWTDDDTVSPLLDLIFADWTTSAGGVVLVEDD